VGVITHQTSKITSMKTRSLIAIIIVVTLATAAILSGVIYAITHPELLAQ